MIRRRPCRSACRAVAAAWRPASAIGCSQRCSRTNEISGPAYTGRVVKIFEKRRDAVLGVFRVFKDGTFRMEPVERRQPELIIEPEFIGDARDGDLVEVEAARAGRYGLPRGKVIAVLGSLTSEKAVSMIAIHAHDIPHIFPQTVIAEAEAAKPATMAHREDWRDLPLVTIDPADAKDHDDAVFAEPDTDPEESRRLHCDCGDRRCRRLCAAGLGARPRGAEARQFGLFSDRVVPMLPERISNDLCSLREKQDRPALAVRMTFAADGRKLRHSFHRIMMRSSAKLAYRRRKRRSTAGPTTPPGRSWTACSSHCGPPTRC